jgi:hypothetical protein
MHDKATVSRPRKKNAPSKLVGLKRAEASLSVYKDAFSNLKGFVDAVTDLTEEHAPAAVVNQLEKGRTAAYRKYIAECEKAAAIETPKPMLQPERYQTDLGGFNTIGKWIDVQEGISRTRMLVPEVIIGRAGQNDTDRNYDATFYDPADMGFLSLMFRFWMRDYTHWYSVDEPDSVWVLSHYGFEFPAPDYDGWLIYDAETRLILSSYINADSAGVLQVDYLAHEQPVGGAPPSTFESYGRHVGQRTFVTTGFANLSFSIQGKMRVEQGQRSRLWLGVATLASAKGGVAGTHGWSYLRVEPPTGESQAGVRYRIAPG